MSRPVPNPGILDIAPYTPGKSPVPEPGRKVFKLSANETPFGPSPKAKEAYRNAVEHLEAGRQTAPVDRMGVQDEQLQLRSALSDVCIRACGGLPCLRAVAILRPPPSQGKCAATDHGGTEPTLTINRTRAAIPAGDESGETRRDGP